MSCYSDKLKKFFGKRDNRNALFIAVMAALPVVQFLIFYVYLNINSVIMAFQTYIVKDDGTAGYAWYGFENFRRAFNEYSMDGLIWIEVKNSLLYFLTMAGISTPLALFFSFYIYKKRFGAPLFKIVLFLPSIISSIVIVLMYKFFMDSALPNVLTSLLDTEIRPLASTKDTSLGTVLFFCVWTGFGSGILMYSGAMGSISESMVEASHLDGASLIQEFWYITLPCVYPTLSTFLIAQLAGIFSADMNLYSFYGASAERYNWTVGYDLLRQTRSASYAEYPYLASIGVTLTMITLPIAYGGKYLLNKFGPSTD